MVGFVRQQHMFGHAVCIGIESYSADPHLTTGAYDSDGDFATVGNNYFLEHTCGFG